MSDFPFAIEVDVYPSNGVIFNVARAEWVQQATNTGDGVFVVYTGAQPGLSIAGYDGPYVTVVPYSYIEDFVTRSGKIKIYYDITANVAPDAGALVFLEGLLVENVAQMTPGHIWATVQYAADSTSEVASFNGRTGAVTLTQADVSAAMPIATSAVLGGVKQGTGVTIAGDGTINATGSGGTVTSVALTAPAEFSVAGSPITGNGTIAISHATQTANRVFAGPTSGGAAAPTFRALVAADIPALDAAKITTGVFTTAQIPTLDVSQIPSLPASKITSGTLGTAQIPDLDAAKISGGNLSIGSLVATTGNITTKGLVSSAVTDAVASITNSGATLEGAANYGRVNYYSSSEPANGKNFETIFIGGQYVMRFANDAHNAFAAAMTFTGTATAITGITSNSGSGSWEHTGNFTVQSGSISASLGAAPASPTNSGVKLSYNTNWAITGFYDSSRPVNNRTTELLYVGGAMVFRFTNDASTAFVDWFKVTGGQAAGVSKIETTSGTGNWEHTGGLSTTSSAILSSGYTVATLPTASAALKGARAYVNDATAPTFLGTLTGGGSVVCPVFCNGTEWVAG